MGVGVKQFKLFVSEFDKVMRPNSAWIQLRVLLSNRTLQYSIVFLMFRLSGRTWLKYLNYIESKFVFVTSKIATLCIANKHKTPV